MIKVLAFGTFDLLHLGHLHYLNQAKTFGEELIVVVARDETAEKLKGKKPTNSQETRLKIIQSLKVVDKALLGNSLEQSKFKIVKDINPNIIAIGYDQILNLNEFKNQLNGQRIKAEIKVISKFKPETHKSSKIKEKIRNGIE